MVMLLVRLVLNAVALGVATFIVPGITLTGGDDVRRAVVLLFVALIFGLVNAVVKPVFRFVTSPLVWLTLGLFLLVINAVMLLLTSWISGLVDLGWNVDGFWSALFGAVLVSIVSFLLNLLLPERRGERRR